MNVNELVGVVIWGASKFPFYDIYIFTYDVRQKVVVFKRQRTHLN